MAKAKKQTAIEPEVVTSEGGVASGDPVEGGVASGDLVTGPPEVWVFDVDTLTLTVGDRSTSVPLSTPGTLDDLCNIARKQLYGA